MKIMETQFVAKLNDDGWDVLLKRSINETSRQDTGADPAHD